MSNPFKKISNNAKTSKNTQFEYLEKKHSKVTTISCECCGAPRPLKTNLVKCTYCGNLFMNINSEIKSE